MDSFRFYRKKLYLAELRFYEDGKGVDSEILSYGILVETKESKNFSNFFNVLNLYDDYPIFSCGPNSNNLYLNKYDYICGSKETGPCWVIKGNLANEFNCDIVTKDMLNDYVLNDDRFFIDRKAIIFNKLKSGKNLLKLMKLLKKDNNYKEYYDYYIENKMSKCSNKFKSNK